MSQFISLEQAIEMAALYRQQRNNILAESFRGQDILAISETFERDVYDTLLAKPGAVAIRMYFGMDESLKVHLIIVPVNEKGEDILPENMTALADGGHIGDTGTRCPPQCPPPSPLNTP